jgi:hypothetical protein
MLVCSGLRLIEGAQSEFFNSNTHLSRANMAPSKKAKYKGKYQHKKKEVIECGPKALPEGALFVIAEYLAEVEPGGVRGPSLVARDLCSLGMVSCTCTDTQQQLCRGKSLLLLLPAVTAAALLVSLAQLAMQVHTALQPLTGSDAWFYVSEIATARLHRFCTASTIASLTRSNC